MRKRHCAVSANWRTTVYLDLSGKQSLPLFFLGVSHVYRRIFPLLYKEGTKGRLAKLRCTTLVPLLLATIAAAICLSLPEHAAAQSKPTTLEEPTYRQAPNFRLTAIDDSVLELADYSGKVVLLNFWATWCAPCRWEIPHLVSLYTEHKDDGLVVIGIAVQSGSMEKVREFANSFGMNYNVVSGNDVEVARVVLDYGGFTSIPTTFLIDRQGRVRRYYLGPRSKETFWDDIKPLL